MISLPQRLELTCPACKRCCSVGCTDLDGIDSLSCPFCSSSHPLVEMLPPTLKLLVYRELREQLEGKALDFLNTSSQNGQDTK